MMTRDPHQFSSELDDESLLQLIGRLERRAEDDVFSRLLDKYLLKLNLNEHSRILEIGCGTGAVLRRLARSGRSFREAVGIDQSATFVESARRFARHEGHAEKLTFCVGDAHELKFSDSSFDIVIAHTVVSHLKKPLVAIREMARVSASGGRVVIFDGDYCSLTYEMADRVLGRRMDEALTAVTFSNPRIMRELPGLFPQLGLKLVDGWGDAVTEIGSASYFRSFAQTYVPYVHRAGLLSKDKIDEWVEKQNCAMESGTCFACCNYYTYVTEPICHRSGRGSGVKNRKRVSSTLRP